MVRVLLLLLLVSVLVLGATIGYFNAQPVDFDYLFGVWQVPLAGLLIAAFAVGVVLALLAAASRILGLRLELRRLRQQIRDHEIELRNLRELPLGSDSTANRQP
jgi:putative membrane protein